MRGSTPCCRHATHSARAAHQGLSNGVVDLVVRLAQVLHNHRSARDL
jgi:hypothetical protein